MRSPSVKISIDRYHHNFTRLLNEYRTDFLCRIQLLVPLFAKRISLTALQAPQFSRLPRGFPYGLFYFGRIFAYRYSLARGPRAGWASFRTLSTDNGNRRLLTRLCTSSN